jgi:putative transposase
MSPSIRPRRGLLGSCSRLARWRRRHGICRDQIYGERFSRQARTLDIEEAVIERVIGSIRRECLGHVVVIGERHLMKIVSEYVAHYDSSRTPISLGRDAPEPRSVQPLSQGRVVVSRVGGLHHEYVRRAA